MSKNKCASCGEVRASNQELIIDALEGALNQIKGDNPIMGGVVWEVAQDGEMRNGEHYDLPWAKVSMSFTVHLNGEAPACGCQFRNFKEGMGR